MSHWLPSALLSLFSFGLWGLLTKLTVLRIDSKSALLYQSVGVFLVGIFVFSLFRFKPATDLKGMMYALLTGLVYSSGCLFYFMAADKGKLIPVITLTALYPFITILLSCLILQEAINIRQCIGIVCAFLSIVLMSL